MSAAGLGVMAMPQNFAYGKLMRQGRPKHRKFDEFYMKHPTMEPGRRAKIFSPFDALTGFGEAVTAKQIRYCQRQELSEEQCRELDRRLDILKSLTLNGRTAKASLVRVRITYYVPCSDANSFAYGTEGQYLTVSGICWKIDTQITKTITVGDRCIPLGDVAEINAEDSTLFECDGWSG